MKADWRKIYQLRFLNGDTLTLFGNEVCIVDSSRNYPHQVVTKNRNSNRFHVYDDVKSVWFEYSSKEEN